MSGYYNHNGIEAWDIIDTVMDYYDSEIPMREAGYVWNALKYILRFPFKGDRNSDIDKAVDYLNKLRKDSNDPTGN